MKDDKLFRVTFSQAVAQHILTYFPDHQIKLIDIIVGPEIKPGDNPTGLYGIVNRKTGRLLRATCIREAAELMTDGDSRYVAKCWIGDISDFNRPKGTTKETTHV